MEDEVAATVKRRSTTEDDITAEVLRRIEGTPDPRLRRVMLGLVKHLHAFVKEVELTEPEWFEGIKFLTATGQKCTDIRQEFILLSDTLGVSMVVDLINHRKPEGATESTVFGPFHRDGAPEMPAGGNISPKDQKGVPTLIRGRVLDLEGRPIVGALLDVWQADSHGLYDSQNPNSEDLHMRGKFRTDKDGGFVVRTTLPVAYTIPTDGPVGAMLKATGRHPWRPAHTHFVVSAPGFEPVTTHLFESTDKYLDSDTVFGVKDSLICEFARHETADAAAKQFGVAAPYYTADFDFVLKPAMATAGVGR
jgi:catechol 1,2-dioxygenase